MPARLRLHSNTGQIHAAESHVLIDLTRPTSGRTGLVYCHARSETAFGVVDTRGFDYSKIGPRIAQAGIPVISADLSGTGHWGNDTALARITEAWAFLQAQAGVRADRVLLYGPSMGALTALNYAKANPSLVTGVAGSFPAMDMQDTGLSTPYQSEMDTAYTNNAGFLAGLPTHNPATYAASMTVPTRLLYSTADTTARPTPVTAYAALATSCATRATVSAGAHITSALSDVEIAWVVDFLVSRA